jgi:hypothetical protein
MAAVPGTGSDPAHAARPTELIRLSDSGTFVTELPDIAGAGSAILGDARSTGAARR